MAKITEQELIEAAIVELEEGIQGSLNNDEGIHEKTCSGGLKGVLLSRRDANTVLRILKKYTK